MKSASILFYLLLYTTTVASRCPPGNYIYNGTCQVCPKGMFQDGRNQRGCKPCQGNTVSTEPGSTICEACKRHSTPSEFKHECECNNNAIMDPAGRCRVCKPGFSKHDFGRFGVGCVECLIGAFSPRSGTTECERCPEGMTSKKGGTKCLRCGEGEYVSKSQRCKVCGPGFGRFENRCRKCKPGAYKTADGFQACLPCPPGSYSHEGASRCKNCPPGTRLMKMGRCGSCAAGERYDAELRECVKCKANTFMPYRNIRTECFACSGDSIAVEGSVRCTVCARDTEPHRNGTCITCPPHAIYDIDMGYCRSCGLNYVVRSPIAEQCARCPDGSFALPKSNECFTCPRGQGLMLKRGGCGSCPPGKWYDRGLAKCRACLEGTVKESRGVHSCVKCESGKTNEERTACMT